MMKSAVKLRYILIYIVMIVIGVQVVNTGQTLNAQLPDPKEVISKSIAAMGGEKALQGMFDYKAEGDVIFYYGRREIRATLTEIRKGWKYWSKREMKFRGSTMVSVGAFDGKSTAWSERRGTVTNQPALTYESDFAHTVLQLVEKGAVFASVEGIELDGKQTVGVEVTVKGKKTLYYFDPGDYILLEIRYKDFYFGENDTKEQIEKRIQYSQYKAVGGYKFPYRQVFYKKGKKQKEVVFKTVTQNPEVKKDIFDRPEQEMDYRYSDEKIH